MNGEDSSAVLDSLWLQDLVRNAQLFAGSAIDAPLTSFSLLIDQMIEALPPQLNPAECFAARTVLLEAVIAVGTTLHVRLHGIRPHCCDFRPADIAVATWREHRLSPSGFLRDWAARAMVEMRTVQALLELAQECSARHWRDALSVDDVAQELGVPAATIERVFRLSSGLSFSKYHRGVRLAKAVELLATTDLKVDGIAYEVGFRSKKNFYKAFQLWTGLTPRQFRAGSALADNWHTRVPPPFQGRLRAAAGARTPQPSGFITSRTVTATRAARLPASCSRC